MLSPHRGDTHSQPSVESRLRITEVFLSLQGEAASSGIPTVFIRLTGCPMRCTYCDTAYAFEGGKSRSIAELLAEVADYGVNSVTVTGGEPLAQSNCRLLLQSLCSEGFSVSLETGGALPIADIDPAVSIVLDIKAPASGESHRNLWENLDLLRPSDQIKFVLSDEQDFNWARSVVQRYNLTRRTEHIFFSPAWGQLSAARLGEWIIRERLQVRLQLQLHKILWGDVRGR